MEDGRLLVDVLGPLRAFADGVEIDLGPPKQRALFAALALQAGTVVSLDELVDRIWGTTAPATARGSLHTYASGLRLVLGRHHEALHSTTAGYTLHLDDDAIDERVVEQLALRARRASETEDHHTALAALDQALSRWRSREGLSDVPGPYAADHRTQLAALRLRLVIERTALVTATASDPHTIADAADQLSREVGDAPYDERLRVVLMQALHRGERTADALGHYDSLRKTLAEELGIDPSATTQAAHAAILTDDPTDHPTDTATDQDDVAPAQPVGRAATATATSVELTTMPLVPAQLPSDTGGFVGRADELVELLRSSESEGARGPRVVTVVGVGGVGKTTLAVHAGHLLKDHFPDGQFHVDLRGFDARRAALSPAVALGQFLASLGVDSVPQELRQRVTLWRTLMADRRMLVVLDNAANADQVEDLLPGGQGTFVVVTSRNRLAGLSVRHGARRVSLGSLTEAESLSLLGEALGPERVEAEAEAARRLVQLCDRLPFALRIAAEQVHLDPDAGLTALVARLEDAQHRLDALELADDQLASIRSVLSCSLQALSAEAGLLLGLLGSLPVTSTTDLAVAALLDVEPGRANAILGELCSQHLLARSHGRFTMHDLTRAYAAEVGAAIAEDQRREALGRLLAWYVATLAQHPSSTLPFDRPAVRHTIPAIEDQSAVLRWCVPEMTNVTALVRDAHVHGHHHLTWQLTFALFFPFYAFGDATEWLEVLRVATRSADALGERRARAVMLNHTSVACGRLGQRDLAIERMREAIDVLGDDPWSYRAAMLGNLAIALCQAEDYESAQGPALEGLRLAQELDDDYYFASMSAILCQLNVELENWREALVHGEPGLEAARRSGDVMPEVDLQVNLGRAAAGLRDHAAAQDYFHAAIRLGADMRSGHHEGLALLGLARIHKVRGDDASLLEATELAEKALTHLEAYGAPEAADAHELVNQLRLEAPGPH